MSEAEDILLDAAAHVGALTRALWARGAAPGDAAARRGAAAQRRIAAWLQATSGSALPIHPCDAPPAPGWLERALGRPAPWRGQVRASAWTDATRLFLPREQLEASDALESTPLLLAALAQGRRVASGRAPAPPAVPLERDVRFALEAALGDAELAGALPGLGDALDAARRTALRRRPKLSLLRPAERVVEELVGALLTGPAREATRALEGVLGEPPESGSIAELARRTARRLANEPGGYRGVAPVEHWGVPAGPGPGASHPYPAAPGAGARVQRPRTRTLPRHLERRAADAQDDPGRPGPFVLPSGAPHLAVQDARGLVRPEDRGDPELDALAEELARAGELPVVHGGSEAREVMEAAGGARRAPAGHAASTPPAGLALTYPEWDASAGAYRDPGIVLRELPVSDSDLAWAARVRREQGPLLAQLRRHFDALRPRRERIGRQLEGDLVDMDAIVDDFAERRAGLSPEGRFYARERPRRRDVAVLLLVDASGSTDAWVSRQQRVIDVEKQAALCLGEALTALGDRHAICAFSGRGPRDVRVSVAKRFDEPWSDAARGRLGALQPDRATRMGGPIRHATALLARQPARVRLLLVLSDGKPDDEDVYEGEYGLADVRQAVFEARRARVQPFCVTIDHAGPAYLPQLFGPAGYSVLWDVQQLPARLPAIYRRLAVP